MGKRRMLNYEIIDGLDFMTLSDKVRCAYMIMCLHGDDEGFVNNPKMLGVGKPALRTLEEAGFIFCFESGVVLIRHWYEHNLIRKDCFKETRHQKERAQVTLDKRKLYQRISLQECDEAGTQPCQNGNGFVPQDNTIQNNPTQHKERQDKQQAAVAAPAVSAPPLSDKEKEFNLFWESYPNKIDRKSAMDAFENVDVPLNVLLAALEQQKKLRQWTDEGGIFVPNPANWLRKRRWEDQRNSPAAVGAAGGLGTEELEAIRRALAEG